MCNPRRASAAVQRRAITVSSVLLVTAILVLALNTSSTGLLAGPALAAGDGANTISGDGKFASERTFDDTAATAIAESSDDSVDSVLVPATGDENSTPNVIKEVAGVTGETELSAEEEREAIRNGWGTWRTADGPESVVAQ